MFLIKLFHLWCGLCLPEDIFYEKKKLFNIINVRETLLKFLSLILNITSQYKLKKQKKNLILNRHFKKTSLVFHISIQYLLSAKHFEKCAIENYDEWLRYIFHRKNRIKNFPILMKSFHPHEIFSRRQVILL